MKFQALMIAAALTLGAAYAQAAPSDVQSGASEKHKIVKMHKAKKMSHKAHASLKREQHLARARAHEMHARAERHEMHARAHMNTRTLGAGPSVNLNSSSRERRMDQAYADWQNRARR